MSQTSQKSETSDAYQNDKRDLTQGSVWENLYKLAGPMVLGIIAVLSISIVDTYFVGKLGTKPLAALSFTFSVTMAIASLSIGLSAGAASIVSRAKGAKNKDKVCRSSTDSLLLSLLIVFIICIIGFFTIDPLFSLLGAKGETLHMVERYMRIWYISMPFLVIPMVANGLIRSLGDSFWPSVSMTLSAIINIGLTPLFIFGFGIIPAMNIEGAAIATAIARCLSFFFALHILGIREKMLTLKFPSISKIWESWKEIFRIGVPAALGNATNPIAIGIVTAIVATYGDEAVAAFGAATRIESFAAIVMLALSAAIGPMAGQNWGAGKRDRVVKAQKVSYKTCVVWSFVLAFFFFFTNDLIASLFTKDQEVKELISLYLLIVPISLWGYGITIVSAGCYNAINHPYIGLSMYLIRSAVFYVPLSWFAALIFNDVIFIFVAITIANIIAGGIVAFYALRKIKNI
jgi:putative MATE family efflux protein